MKKLFYYCLITIGLSSCNSNLEGVATIKGNVEGLKKGTIYLQKFDEQGNTFNLDSVIANGKGTFAFEVALQSPEILSLYLDKKDGNEFGNRILFFAEPQSMTINTHNETFDLTAKIEGSETHKYLEEYNQTLRRFGTRNTELLAEQIQALKSNNLKLADSISNISNKNKARQYLFAINYALNHKNSYIAPYIALTQSEGIQPKYLDSIYNSLSKEVSDSKYGKQLKELIEEYNK